MLAHDFAVAAIADAASIKGTVSAITGDETAQPSLLIGVRLTLVNRDLRSTPVTALTDAAGNFTFTDLPEATYVLTAEADGFPAVTREINLSSGASFEIEIVLRASLSESVYVREEEGLLSTGETTTTNTIRSQTLQNSPLRAENYQSALLLTPGVVRGRDGADHLKGARAGQSAYTVNGADVTDPVTGALAFDIPLEAAAGVQVEENPYSAEFGRLSGGASALETKGGGEKFRLNVTRFFPTFHNVIGGQLDSFRPRLTFSGPLIRNKLFFLQSFEYRFSRAYVPSLPDGRDDSTSESFNSFTQFDLTVNKKNRVKFAAAIFPQNVRFVGLNTFNPQEVTPNVERRGSLFALSEQIVFTDTSFLASSLSFKTFDVDVLPQGAEPLIISPDGNSGNYFAESRRRTRRLQWQETFYANSFTLGGQHSFKLGTEFYRTQIDASFRHRPLLIRRSDQTLAKSVDFVGYEPASRPATEVAAFAQDRWVVGKRLTIDAGLRYDRNSLARRHDFGPRLSFLFLPIKGDRTIVRGGVGLFFDRFPLGVGYFAPETRSDEANGFSRFPERVITTFAPDGTTVTDGPRRFVNRVEGQLRDPRSLRWSVQLDQGLTKDLTVRAGYLQRSTTNDFIIEPTPGELQAGTLLLSNRGRSRYRELQVVATYRGRRLGDWTTSYVWSDARSDLNTVDNFLGDFPSLVIPRNEYGRLPWDAPHRLLAFGQLKTRFGITISPAVEIRSGYPYSVTDELLDFIGRRGEAGRFPAFVSLDLQVTKDFVIPKFIPRLEGKRARVGAAIFNITNHFNPQDVQNNIGSTRFGQFYNSLGPSVRGKFELDF